MHALLPWHLEQAGKVDGVPRVLGFDEQGRQMLTYLPGEMIGDRVPLARLGVRGTRLLVQVGQWIRRIHDATSLSLFRRRMSGGSSVAR